MRIISGVARGTKLYTLEGQSTRPTLDRIKEPLFSIIQNHIKDASVLDLFSGSGALGLEALSRGAKKAVLCDSSKEAIAIIQKNAIKTHMEEKTKILYMDYQMCLKNQKEVFDIIFLDPPYEKNIGVNAIQLILQYHLLAENGMIILETDELDRELRQIEKIKNNINIYDLIKYLKVKLIFLK